jgi:hypothetical protein
MGHDRFVADLRSIARPRSSSARGRHGEPGTASVSALCCHPYDLCAELIARECGVVVTDESDGPLRAPLNVEADVSWVGYANARLHATVGPVLLDALRARGWTA